MYVQLQGSLFQGTNVPENIIFFSNIPKYLMKQMKYSQIITPAPKFTTQNTEFSSIIGLHTICSFSNKLSPQSFINHFLTSGPGQRTKWREGATEGDNLLFPPEREELGLSHHITYLEHFQRWEVHKLRQKAHFSLGFLWLPASQEVPELLRLGSNTVRNWRKASNRTYRRD